MHDYPDSMKNMKELERKRAVDIANALLADGYPDDRAISIAMKQAERWYANASSKERPHSKLSPIPQNMIHIKQTRDIPVY